MTNVRVVRVPDSDTSVIASWDRIEVPGITGYRVYYGVVSSRMRQSEMSITVPSTQNFATITGLVRGVEYQFQVAVTGILLGEFFEGNRSEPDAMSRISLRPLITTQPTIPRESGSNTYRRTSKGILEAVKCASYIINTLGHLLDRWSFVRSVLYQSSYKRVGIDSIISMTW